MLERVTGDDTRSEMSRILASAVANGSLTTENRAYLVQLVSQRAGISQQEAERRVDQAFNAAREAADKARRAGVLTGFVTAASLVLSLGAAWWAAHAGRAPSRQFDPGAVRLRRSAPPHPSNHLKGDYSMLRDVVLWMAGVPIFVIILLHLFGVFH